MNSQIARSHPSPYALLAALALCMASFVWLTSDILAMLIAYLAVYAVGARMLKGDLLHPFMWFGGAYIAYSAAGPILTYFDIHPTPLWAGYKLPDSAFVQAMRVQAIAGIFCLVAMGVEIRDARRALGDPAERWKIQSFVWPFFFVTAIAALALIRHVAFGGYTDKNQLIAQGDAFSRASFLFIMLSTISTVIVVQLALARRRFATFFFSACVLALFLVVVLTMGQRNYLFRLVVLLMMLAVAFGWRPRLWFLIPAGAAGAVLATVLGAFKMSLTGASSAPADLAAGSIVYQFLQRSGEVGSWSIATMLQLALYAALGSELMTPGTNLALLIGEWPRAYGYYGLSNVWNEFTVACMPGFIIGTHLPDTSGIIFANTFFPGYLDAGKGYGFGLVAEGYLSFGTAGAIILMTLYGFVLRWAYASAGRGIIWFLFYINCIPIAVFTLRADLSAIFSQSWKHVWFPLALIYAANVLVRQYSGNGKLNAAVS